MDEEEDIEDKIADIIQDAKNGELYEYEAAEKILRLFNYDEESVTGHCNKCGENCDYC